MRAVILGGLFLALGCGSVVDVEQVPTAVSVPITHCAAPTAPLLDLGAIADRRVEAGPCGDVLFAREDESVWLRTAGGKLSQLAAHGRIGAFAATGELVSFVRDGMSVVRNLDTDTEISVSVNDVRFGYDEATQRPLPFTCAADGVQVLRGSTLGAPVPGSSGLRCGEHAPFGATLLASDASAGKLAFVDLAHETVVRAAVEFLQVGSFGTDSRRQDYVHLTLDGRLAFYERIVRTRCGDTDCADVHGTDILRTDTGTTIRHVGSSLSRGGFASGREVSGLLERGHTLVGLFGSPTFSVESSTLRFAEYPEGTSVLRVRDDGQLVLAHDSRSARRVTVAEPGSAVETPWFVTTPGAAIGAAADGPRALVVEKSHDIHVAGTSSTWGSGDYGDLVLREGDREVARLPLFSTLGDLTFLPNGRTVFSALRYPTAPPSETDDLSSLGLAQSLYALSPDGSLETLEGDSNAQNGAPVQAGAALVFLRHTYDSRSRRFWLDAYDAGSLTPRILSESNDGIEPVSTLWRQPSGTISMVVRTAQGAAQTTTLLHGIP